RMLPDSLLSAVNACSLLTVMPASLTNEVVMMKKMSRLSTKSSIGARSMPVSSLSASECRRDCMAGSSGALGRSDGNVLHAALPDVVEDWQEQGGVSALRRDHHHAVVRTLRVQPLDIGPDGAHIDRMLVDDDRAGGIDPDQDAARLFLLLVGGGIGPAHS